MGHVADSSKQSCPPFVQFRCSNVLAFEIYICIIIPPFLIFLPYMPFFAILEVWRRIHRNNNRALRNILPPFFLSFLVLGSNGVAKGTQDLFLGITGISILDNRTVQYLVGIFGGNGTDFGFGTAVCYRDRRRNNGTTAAFCS